MKQKDKELQEFALKIINSKIYKADQYTSMILDISQKDGDSLTDKQRNALMTHINKNVDILL